MFFTFSMLPIKEMGHSKCKSNSTQVKIADYTGLGSHSYRDRLGHGTFTFSSIKISPAKKLFGASAGSFMVQKPINLISNHKVILILKNNVFWFINLHVLYKTGTCSVESLYLLLTPMSKGLPLLRK